MILGNKSDMDDKRQVIQLIINWEMNLFIKFWIYIKVSKNHGEQLAIKYGIKFMETSAKESTNIEEAFFTLVRDLKVKMEKKLVNFVNYALSVKKKKITCVFDGCYLTVWPNVTNP